MSFRLVPKLMTLDDPERCNYLFLGRRNFEILLADGAKICQGKYAKMSHSFVRYCLKPTREPKITANSVYPNFYMGYGPLGPLYTASPHRPFFVSIHRRDERCKTPRSAQNLCADYSYTVS